MGTIAAIIPFSLGELLIRIAYRISDAARSPDVASTEKTPFV